MLCVSAYTTLYVLGRGVDTQTQFIDASAAKRLCDDGLTLPVDVHHMASADLIQTEQNEGLALPSKLVYSTCAFAPIETG